MLTEKRREVPRPVAKSEELYVIANYKDMTSAQIAENLDCDKDRVEYIEKLLGLRKYEPWSDKKSEQLTLCCAQDMRPSDIARQLGVSQKSVYNHMKEMGLSTRGSAPGRPRKH